MIARKVPNSITPLPHDKRFAGSNSGSNPYLEGPKSAACVATSVSAAREIGSLCVASPARATSIEVISIPLVQIVICRLLNRSASQPPVMLKSTNGTENSSVAIETKLSR